MVEFLKKFENRGIKIARVNNNNNNNNNNNFIEIRLQDTIDK